MHDEFERAYTGKSKKGLSPFAWVLFAIGGFVGVGLLALTVIGLFIARQVEHTMEEFQNQVVQIGEELDFEYSIEDGQGLSATRKLAEALVSLNPELEVVGGDESRGMLELRNQSAGDVSSLTYQDIIKGHLTINSDEGVIRLDLEGDEDGGSFVISNDGDEVFSMRLQTEDDGGRLVIRTEEGSSYFQAGEHAVDVPRWVPMYPDAREERGVFSAKTGEGDAGAIVIETSDSPDEVLEYYVDQMERDGFEPRVSGRLSSDEGEFDASLTGHASDDRFVAVFLGQENGTTRILLTWGEEG